MRIQRSTLPAIVISCFLFVLSAVPVDAADTPFDFRLRSHEGREWSSQDFADKQLVVVAFLGTECPLVKLYGPRLQELHDEFQDKVAVVGMNSNTQDSITEINAYANRHDIRFPLLKDVNNVVADQFGAQRTPEVFLLDADRKVRYRGRIDDQYSVGTIRDRAAKHDLREAIEQLLAGKEVTTPETEAVGCHIGRVQKVSPQGDITYTKHIAPIFFAHCVECHRDGELAPFPLTSYDDVVGWEETICEVIEDNRMPPWFANPEHGQFKNDCRLSDEQKQLVYDWVENGMPRGDEKDLPALPEFDDGWRIPKPDEVYYMRKTPFSVKAQGTINYQHFLVDPGWEEDKYICAAEARPDNKSVVHHILVYIIAPDGQPRPRLDRILVGYAPGSTPVKLEEGVAMRVEAGSKLLFQMHYTPNGYPESDRSYAGVKFVDKDQVKKLIRGRIALEKDDLAIPPNAAEHHVVAPPYHILSDELLVSMTPHMHLRGAAFRYEAEYPDGKREILLDVPQYDFNWQLKYILDEPKLLPRGTKIHCSAVFDNSDANPVNPDPTTTVRWGNQSWEEMMIGFFDTLPIRDMTDSGPLRSVSDLDPSGVYTWTGRMPGVLTLTMQDEVLRGTVEVAGKKSEIQNAQLMGDRLTFSAKSPAIPQAVIEFDTVLSGDQLKGKVTFAVEQFGRAQVFPWQAQRQ